METRRKNRTRSSAGDEDEQAATVLATPTGDSKVLLAGQQSARSPADSPPSGSLLREAHSRLAELLHVTASILGDIHREEAAAWVGDAAQRATDVAVAGSANPAQSFEFPGTPGEASAGSQVHPGARVTSSPSGDQSGSAASLAARRTQEAAILAVASDTVPAKNEDVRLPRGRAPSIAVMTGRPSSAASCPIARWLGGRRRRRSDHSRQHWTTTSSPLSLQYRRRTGPRCSRRSSTCK
ncbi:unnamed protein product [Lampetra fluviatilis]